MASISENQINLKTLQRVDSTIVEIIDNACQVAIYKYESKLGKWEETDVEGALFLYRRSCYPYYGFIIVNRMSTTNFIESITSDMQFQLQSPYLLYKNHSGDIIGSWFYEHNDLQRISKTIQTIILKHNPPPKRQRRASESETQDILTLLCEAHEEYLKKEKFQNVSCENLNSLNHSKGKKNSEKSVEKENCQNNCSSLSPHRRYISTGSFDSSHPKCVPCVLSSCDSILEIKKKNMKSSIASIAEVIPLINQIHARDNLPIRKNTYLSEVKEETSHSPLSDPPNWPDSVNGKSDIHLACMKEAMRLHVERNSGFMPKIHEAYVSSLKTYFTS